MAATDFVEEFRKLAEQSYNGVYEHFALFAKSDGVSLTLPAGNKSAFVATKSAPQHANSIDIKGAVRIDGLKHRRGRDPEITPHHPGICVLLDSAEVYKFDRKKPNIENSYLYKSQVRVAYFRPGTGKLKGKWEPLLCIRYEFDKSHDAHPVFHAQMENGTVGPDIQQMFGGLPAIEGQLVTHTKVRVPTANVVGATALLSLAADHLPLTQFPAVLSKVRQQPLFKADWRCNFESMDDEKQPDAMLSSRWYSSRVGV